MRIFLVFVYSWLYTNCLVIVNSAEPLNSFILDLQDGRVQINFNYIVNATTFEVGNIGLVLNRGSALSTPIFRFSGTYNNMHKQGNTSHLYFYITSDDFARLTLEQLVGKSTQNTYLIMDSNTILSPNGTQNPVINTSHAFQLTQFIPDENRPYLDGFDLDMDHGVIILDFSEPVNVTSFTFHGLALQSLSNVFPLTPNQYNPGIYKPPQWPFGADKYGIKGLFVPLVDAFTDLVSVMNYNRRLIFTLGDANMNGIKANLDLCTSQINCFISGYKSFVNDSYGNALSIAGFELINGLQVNNFTADVTPPVFRRWSLDLNDGNLTLYFSEVVLVDTGLFNYSAISLQGSKTSPAGLIRLTVPISPPPLNTANVSFRLNRRDFDRFKDSKAMGKVANATFLALDFGACSDTSPARNLYQGLDATAWSARRVSRLVPDVTRPQLLSAVLNITSQTLRLHFSEIMNISSFQASRLNLQSLDIVTKYTETITFSAAFAQVLNRHNDDTLLLKFTFRGFSELKLMPHLARASFHSFVSFSKNMILDLGGYPIGNMVVPISTGKAFNVEYFPDYQAPELVSWTVDMSQNLLTMNFSEPLDLSTIDMTAVSLQSSFVAKASMTSVRLSSQSRVVKSSSSSILIRLSTADANNVKSQPPLCTRSSNCYLQIGRGFAFDTSTFVNETSTVHNAVTPVTTPLLSSIFTRDGVPPSLLSFQVDMNDGVIVLLFSKPVLGQLMNSSGLTLYDSTSITASMFQLSEYSFVKEVISHKITLVLGPDFIPLQSAAGVATSLDTTYLSMAQGAVMDVMGNELIGFGELTADGYVGLKAPTAYVTNTATPTIDAVSLNRTSYELSVAFNVAVRVGFVTPAKFYLAYNGETYSLIDTSVLSTGKASVVLFDLSAVYSDILSVGIGATPDTTSLYFPFSRAVTGGSLAYVPSREMSIRNAVREGQRVDLFYLRLSTGDALLQVAVPLVACKVNPASITFVSTLNESVSYTLTGYERVYLAKNGFQVVVVLSSQDLNAIKSVTLLTNDSDALIMTVKATALSDSYHNPLRYTYPVPCGGIVVDTQPPRLVSFSIDFSTTVMTLVFSEPLLYSSVNVSCLSLQNSVSAGSATAVVMLQNSQVMNSGDGGFTLMLNLSFGGFPSDCDRIYATRSIGVSRAWTYLTMTADFATDTAESPNFVVSVNESDAQQVTTIIPDLSAPDITVFDVDMFSRIITVYFDKTVNSSSNKASSYTLWSVAGNRLATHVNLATSTTILSGYTFRNSGTYVKIKISDTDFDAIMAYAPNLCTSSTNTYLTVLKGAVRDTTTTSNPVSEVLYLYAINVNNFRVDTNPPVLLNFDISMQTGIARFYFNKFIKCSATDVTAIKYQYAEFLGVNPYYYELKATSSAPLCNVSYSKEIVVAIGIGDKNQIKSITYLLKSKSYAYLRLFAGAFTDVFGNKITEIVDGRAKQVRNFIGDTVSPKLLGFVTLNGGSMKLIFDEPVQLSKFQPAGIVLQDSKYNATYRYRLKYATVASWDSLFMNVNLNLGYDFYRMTQDSDVFKTQLQTYLTAESRTLSDTSGNPLYPITKALPMVMGPILRAWDLNMITGKLVMDFSDTMNSSFSPVGARFQSGFSSTSRVFVVASSTAFVDVQSPYTFSTTLAKRDLNALKYYSIGESEGTAWLSTDLGLTRSTATETTEPYLLTAPLESVLVLQVRHFVADTDPPVLNFAILDLYRGVFTLVFDKPVLSSSLVVDQVILLSGLVGTSAQLTGDAGVYLHNYTYLSINLTSTDLNSIKEAYSSAALDSVILLPDTVVDTVGNSYAGNDADSLVPIAEIIPDSESPVLKAFQLDMSAGSISLAFDEMVRWSSIDPDHIRLLSNESVDTAISFQFTNYTVVKSSLSNTIEIDFGIFRADACGIDLLDGLAKSINSSYIIISGVRDVFGNLLLMTAPFQATKYIADKTSPRLEGFDFNKGTSAVTVTLYFSKVISVSSFHCEDFRFSSAPSDSATETASLGSSECTLSSSTHSRVLSIEVPSKLSSLALIGTSEALTYMYVPIRGNTTDVLGNKLAVIPLVNAIRVGPKVSSFGLDVQNGVIILQFTRPIVLTSSFNISRIGAYSTASGSSSFFSSNETTLKPFLTSSPAVDDMAVLHLAREDLNNLKLISLAESQVYILSLADAAYDENGISLVPTTIADKIVDRYFVPDVTPPVILRLSLDMGREMLIFEFDEPVQKFSVVPENVRIQQLKHSALVARNLLGGGFIDILKESLTIEIVQQDAAYMKLTPNLAKSRNDSYVSFSFDTMTDLAGNSLLVQPADEARQVDIYIDDNVRPNLVTFGLDMNIGILVLNFSEPVLVPIMNLTNIILQSRYLSNQGYKYTLTGGTILSSSGYFIRIQLSEYDINSIKNTPKLCRSRALSYIRIFSGLSTDTSGNPVVPISDGAALICSQFVTDSSSPVLSSTTLDMTTGILTLSISKAVAMGTVTVPSLTIYQAVGSTISYTLTVSSQVINTGMFTNAIQIKLSTSDLNTIKYRYPLASSAETSWIAFTSSLCQDTFGNPIESIPSYAPVRVTNYIRNQYPPSILTYSLDMNAQVISLVFNESIVQATMDLAQMIVQNNKVRRFGKYTNLSTSSAVTGEDENGNILYITLDKTTVTTMKWYGIGLNLTSSYLSWTDKFVADSAGNFLPPLWDGSVYGFVPIAPNRFVADTSPPNLEKWYIDRTLLRLHLIFDEPVTAYSLGEISLYIGKPSSLTNGTTVDAATSAVTYNAMATELIVDLYEMCLVGYNSTANSSYHFIDKCLTISFLGKVEANSKASLYLSTQNQAVKDRSQKPVRNAAIPVSSALKEGSPDCSLCDAGYYVSVNCTSHSDRICSRCTAACPVGEFARQPCSAYADARCQVCQACNYGQTISKTCSGTEDTVCKSCSVCNALEYEAHACSSARDTICESCQTCDFLTSDARTACAVGTYMWWAQEHCCKDEDGQKSTCRAVNLQDMYISARDGRHHWVFPDSVPRIDGYSIKEHF